jgi:hypothetical protein
MTNLRWPQPRKTFANWRSSQRIRHPWRYRLREEGNEDPFLGTEGGKPKAAHRPPERKRLLPGIVFQQNWHKADIPKLPINVRFRGGINSTSCSSARRVGYI